MKKITCFVLASFLAPQMCAMDGTHDLTMAMEKFRLTDTARGLTDASSRTPDRLLSCAARQGCSRVMRTMLFWGARSHTRDSAIFYNAVGMRDFHLLRLLVKKQALVDVDGFEALLCLPDSMKEGAAKEKTKMRAQLFARELLDRVSIEQKSNIINDALEYNKTRTLYFLRKWDFLPSV